MKNLYKGPAVFGRLASLLGIIAIGAVIILGMAGCSIDGGDDDNNNNGDDWKELLDINVSAYPTKTNYVKGEAFSTAGMKVIATYNPTSVPPAEVTGFITDPANGAVLDKWGLQPVTVSYTEDGVTRTTGFSIGVSEGTITKDSFTGTWGSANGRNTDEAVISNVTDTGATLVYSASNYLSNISGVTLTLTWGASETFTRQIDGGSEEYKGFAITGTLSDAIGNVDAIFGNNGDTLAGGVKIGIYDYLDPGYYDYVGVPQKRLGLTDGTNFLAFDF
jgi:hypothetical protein